MGLAELLEALSNLDGGPGYEDMVRDKICSVAEGYADSMLVDDLGNVILEYGDGDRSLMIAAHMDEVALMITSIDRDGFLRFTNLGGVDPRVLPEPWSECT